MNCFRASTAYLLLAAFAAAASATVMLPLDTGALTRRADQIVLGHVESVTSRWTADHGAIYTDVLVRVEASYKGTTRVGERLTIRREGGSVDGIGMRVAGAASFQVGEQTLLFVEHRAGNSFVVGMAQGKLQVTRSHDGQRYVAPNLAGVAFTQPRTTTSEPRRLEEVEREIRMLVRQQAAPSSAPTQ